MHNADLHGLKCSNTVIKSAGNEWTKLVTHIIKIRTAHKIILDNHKDTLPLGIHKSRLVDNVNIDLRRILRARCLVN
jgi:hypothetical protein